MKRRGSYQLFQPHVQVVVAFIVWRGERKDMEVLTMTRRAPMGARELCLEVQGLVHPQEQQSPTGERTTLTEAVAVVKRETGLGVKPTHLVGIYGPNRGMCSLYQDTQSLIGFGVRQGSEPVSGTPAVITVFAGTVIGGASAQESVSDDFEWMPIGDVVEKYGSNIAADHGQHLAHLVTALRCNGESCFQNPGATVIRFNGVHVG